MVPLYLEHHSFRTALWLRLHRTLHLLRRVPLCLEYLVLHLSHLGQ